MRIWWASEVMRDYNACRLFFTRKSAMKAITKDMESVGYFPFETKKLSKFSTTIEFYNPHKHNDEHYLWHFYHLAMG